MSDTTYVERMPNNIGGEMKNITDRVISKVKLVKEPKKLVKYVKEMGDLTDHLNDFYDPEGYTDYEKHKANAEIVNQNRNWFYKAIAKEMSRRLACKEWLKDPNNPQWNKGNDRCDYLISK